MKALSSEEVLAQSKGALEQWGPRWEKQAVENGEIHKRMGTRHRDLYMRGVGRRVVLCGLGPSLETGMPLLQEYKADVDFACVDKSYLPLMNHGIQPKFVLVADAMIPYRYAEPHIQNSDKSILIACVTCNPEWTRNWRGPVYFYVNKDNLATEQKFSELSGVKEAIPAGSNVGNGLASFITQMLGYDRHLLVGYDYCWEVDGNYYAFQWEEAKRHYMKQVDALSIRGEWVVTSSNLRFSARWLSMYLQQISHVGLDVKNCSRPTLLEWDYCNLEQQLKLARKMGQRKWTTQEREQFVEGHAQNAVLGFEQLDQLNGLLSNQGMQTLNVSLRGIPKQDVAYMNAH